MNIEHQPTLLFLCLGRAKTSTDLTAEFQCVMAEARKGSQPNLVAIRSKITKWQYTKRLALRSAP